MTKAGMIFSGAVVAALVGATAVTLANGGFTALLSSIVTRPSVDRTPAPITSAGPSRGSEVKQAGAIEPEPVPANAAQLPAPAPPASVSSVAGKTGSVPSAQAGGRVTGAEIFVPAAEKGLMPWRTALTAAEKAAVARGLKELERIAAINAQRRAAPYGLALTQAEKASVERGLRELEKAARQAKPSRQR